MLEKPSISDTTIITCLRAEFGIPVDAIEFLPLGADRNTAVYRAITHDAGRYFVKLRRGDFAETSVHTPRFLHQQGIPQVIAPLETHARQLWANLDNFKVMLFPFVEGHSGFEVNLSDKHWVEFGRALKSIHTVTLPPELKSLIPSETYSPHWREVVKQFQKMVTETPFAEPVAQELAAFMQSRHSVINHLVAQAEHLATSLLQSCEFILCHADIHVGNILIDMQDTLYIVDWDTLVLAPKERDLMFVGGGLGGGGHKPHEEETLFYEGYGPTDIDTIALAYYRYERIVQDIAAYCEQILLSDEGGDDRAEGLRQLKSQFLPDQVVQIAEQTAKRLPPERQLP